LNLSGPFPKNQIKSLVFLGLAICRTFFAESMNIVKLCFNHCR